jgi:hypothetical protein
MQWRASIAVCVVFSLISTVVAQDVAALDALFRQAAGRESGSTKDLAGASRVYAEAARQGHTPSMVRPGYLLQSGTGVPPDLSGALALFTRAANAGNLDGQFMLGITYLQGIGTAKDPVTARGWLLKAAGKEHQYAQYLIGMMLESGEGGERREAGARRWLDRASEGPDRNLAVRAAAMRDKIDKNMLAPDNSTGLFVTALLFMALVGTVMQGGVDGGYGGGGAPGPGFGGGPSASPPPCRPVPIPMVGTSMTPNGSALSNPGPGTMMGGC